MPIGRSQRVRVATIVGMVVASAVALIFLTVGDGVPDVDGTGPHAFAVNYLHTAAWVLLSVCLALALMRRRALHIAARVLGLLAGVCYIVFRLALHGVF